MQNFVIVAFGKVWPLDASASCVTSLILESLDWILCQDEELNTSSTVNFGSSRRNSKVSAVTVTESDSESIEQIYGGSRSRQSRLSVTVDIKLSKGIQQVTLLSPYLVLTGKFVR